MWKGNQSFGPLGTNCDLKKYYFVYQVYVYAILADVKYVPRFLTVLLQISKALSQNYNRNDTLIHLVFLLTLKIN